MSIFNLYVVCEFSLSKSRQVSYSYLNLLWLNMEKLIIPEELQFSWSSFKVYYIFRQFHIINIFENLLYTIFSENIWLGFYSNKRGNISIIINIPKINFQLLKNIVLKTQCEKQSRFKLKFTIYFWTWTGKNACMNVTRFSNRTFKWWKL